MQFFFYSSGRFFPGHLFPFFMAANAKNLLQTGYRKDRRKRRRRMAGGEGGRNGALPNDERSLVRNHFIRYYCIQIETVASNSPALLPHGVDRLIYLALCLYFVFYFVSFSFCFSRVGEKKE